MSESQEVIKEDLKTATARKPRASRAKVPAGAKVPQDHRSAKDEVEAPDYYDFEWKGHTYRVEREALDDVEVMEYLTDQNTVGALKLMLGQKLWDTYKKNNRDENTGRVKATEATDFVNHIFEELNAKNS